MPAAIVTQRDLWAPNMVKSMKLLDTVLKEQDRVTVMDPRGGIVPTCPRLIVVLLLKGDSGRHYRLSIRDMDDTGLQSSSRTTSVLKVLLPLNGGADNTAQSPWFTSGTR